MSKYFFASALCTTLHACAGSAQQTLTQTDGAGDIAFLRVQFFVQRATGSVHSL